MTLKIGEPHLFGDEHRVFEQKLRASNRYLEFGMGGSSLLAARIGVQTVVAVDSDPSWVASVRQDLEVAERIESGNMSVIHADIGPVREWGNPLDRSHIHLWPNYIACAWSEWSRRKALPDLVFVDGRFRVACCLSVVVAFRASSAKAPLTMIHDFNEERPHYRDVLEFFEIEALEGSLATLRLRRDAAAPLALARLLHRQFDYG